VNREYCNDIVTLMSKLRDTNKKFDTSHCMQKEQNNNNPVPLN
jgi:hypothetical protein